MLVKAKNNPSQKCFLIGSDHLPTLFCHSHTLKPHSLSMTIFLDWDKHPMSRIKASNASDYPLILISGCKCLLVRLAISWICLFLTASSLLASGSRKGNFCLFVHFALGRSSQKFSLFLKKCKLIFWFEMYLKYPEYVENSR